MSFRVSAKLLRTQPGQNCYVSWGVGWLSQGPLVTVVSELDCDLLLD